MKKGFLSIILHAHLPYVRHPEHESFFEENWLFEAITECYIPLIKVLDRLQKDNLKFRLTLSLSPTLITMLRDDLLQTRFQNHIIKRIELAEKEIARTRTQPKYQVLARLYRRFFVDTLATYKAYDKDLLSAFKKHYAAGNLDLITTAATHGFLPLLNVSKTAVRVQIKVALECFQSNLGFAPSGFWLPECGYYPGLEVELKNAGISYFFTDTHGVMNVSNMPENGVYAPLACENGVKVFARDPDSSHQVWSAEEGYPGNEVYREYYSDIGFDGDLDYIAPYILDDEIRCNTGIKYHRITKQGQEKEVYQPRKAWLKISQDAKDFINNRQQKIEALNAEMDRTPIVVAPYDAELFGHWWFEGPFWLESVIRLASEKNSAIELISCGDYIKQQTDYQIAAPVASTWGDGGYSSFWINEDNDWIYPFLYQADQEMQKLSKDFSGISVSPFQERALNQALRSLLLAQASDWPFIMKAGTTTEYAKKRITDHLARFNYLHDCIRKNRINERYLMALEIMDHIFPDIDFRGYKSDL